MQELIEKVQERVSAHFEDDSTGHDWHHIRRVHELACHLQEEEGGDRTVIELAALLHDISDHKLNGGILNDGARAAGELLKELNCPEELSMKVCAIIDAVSYKGAHVPDVMHTLEGKIVQDADRLDAIGAIGIARAFAYGGSKDRPLYLPDVKPHLHDTFESYVSAKSHTINHFYEKLLLLKDRLHTETARRIGKQRHDFMEAFLQQFYNEWNTKFD